MLAAATLATYGNSLGNGYVWDDQVIVVNNPDNHSAAGLLRVWTSADQISASTSAPYYRPLNRLSYALDGLVFRLDPRVTHAENVLLHLGAVLLLFAMGRRLWNATGPSFVAALLFAVHPINAEPVNFVTARNNLFVGVFVLTACLLWLRARQGGPRWQLGLAGAAFLGGLLCKETAFMVLPLLAGYELLAERGKPWALRLRQALSRLWPMGVATAAYLAARAAVLPTPWGQAVGADRTAALLQGLHIVPKYLALLVWPAGLSNHYAEPQTYFAAPSALVGAWLVIAALTTLLFRQRSWVSLFGLAWFAANYLPISGVVPIPSAPLADRYLYLPAIGAWLVLADQVALAAARPRLRSAVVVLTAVVVLALAARTVARNRDWHDNVRLFASALAVDPASATASYNLGLALAEAGDEAGARRQWEHTLELDPDHVDALSQLGTQLAASGELALARARFERVRALRPDDVEACFNLGLIAERQGQTDQAVRYYRCFLDANPVDYPDLVPRVRGRLEALELGRSDGTAGSSPR